MIKFLIAGAVAVSLAAAGILGAGAANDARVRVIHASPDAPAVDVYANSNRVLSNVPFKASSGYLSVPAGNYTFEVFPAGANRDSASPVLRVDTPLAGGKDYTVIALDSVSQIKGRIFEDDNSAPAAGRAHVSVIHAGPDAPEVDIAVTGGPVLVDSLGFGENAGPLPVNAGAYNLEVRAAGTNNVALPLPGVRLDNGVIYTFVATGFLNGNPSLTVVPYTETATSGSPVAPPSTGDGGLADEGGSNLHLIGALVVIAGAVATLAARKVAVRG